jgi:hypothetical protein
MTMDNWHFLRYHNKPTVYLRLENKIRKGEAASVPKSRAVNSTGE